MKTRLINLWDSFQSSFWFVPSWILILAVGLSFLTGYLDKELAENHLTFEILETTAESSRSTLNSLAGALITLIGVVFSITLLTLSIASSQFGSRIIRNVMTDSISDVVIGLYIGTALFCLLTIRTVRVVDEGHVEFVPQIGTAVASFFGLICIGMLILYIHHVAVSIQAPNLVKNVSEDFYNAVDRLFPENLGKKQPDEDQSPDTVLKDLGLHDFEVTASKEGVIEGIDGDSLVNIAKQIDGVIALDCKPGQYITTHRTLAKVWIQQHDVEDTCEINEKDQIQDDINNVIIVGTNRTPRQDISYAALELVEIATRALSPGINDPFTAMNCIDRLGGGLCRLAERSIPSLVRMDDDSTVRVVINQSDQFQDVLDDSFNLIRQYGEGCVAVTIHLLDTLRNIISHVQRMNHLDAIQDQADAIKARFDKNQFCEKDTQDFLSHFNRFNQTLEEKRNCISKDD